MNNWEEIVQKVSPYIVRIDTPTGSGTGFLCTYNEDKSWCAVATALHVVQQADEWQQPIKVHNYNFKKTAFLKEGFRVILSEYRNDSAAILFERSELDFPDTLIPLRPIDTPIGIGTEVGWLGFPSIALWDLCFFAGPISARQVSNNYLVDGVAINGVSGGPVILPDANGNVEFVGVVSAYRANRALGEALPGLLVAQDVSHFHGVVQQVRSWDEAKKKKTELEAQQKSDAQESS